MPYFLYDSSFLILLPAIALALYAQSRVKTTFKKYMGYRSTRGITGADVAREILRRNGIYDIKVVMTQGTLSDHYDPKNNVIRLSPDVYNSNSIAALGVAAHEVGHVLQNKRSYLPYNIRTAIVPVANIGSKMAFPLLLLGIFLSIPDLITVGIIAFSAAVLFQIVTLPVEFNASKRAISQLTNNGMIYDDEVTPAKKVLNAAALTYVAATLMAVLQLLRLLALSRRR